MLISNLDERHRLEFLTVDNRAEGFCRVCHESLDLLHGARDTGQQLDTICCHSNVIFNANLHTVVTRFSGYVKKNT